MTFQLHGASSAKATRFVPIWQSYFATGLYTQRNPLRGSQSRIYDKFYPSYDSMIDGSNIEISNRLTPIRRPGNSVYNSQTFSGVDFFYDFRLFNGSTEQIKVIVDTTAALYDGTGPTTKNLIWTKSAGAGQTIPLGVGNNLFFGNGVDQKKWVQTLVTWTASTTLGLNNLQTFIIDTNGNIQQLTAAIVPISTVQTDSAVPQNVTIVRSGTTNLTSVTAVGATGTFSGLTTATWLNGVVGTITAVTSTSFTVSTSVTGHAAYGPTADTGIFSLVGGNPITGGSQPTWSVTLLGTTNDNTAQWTNRGSPVENWGIAAGTTVPTVSVGASNVSWQPNTFYSNDQVIVDSNGNLQQVTTKGTSGTTSPTWATVDGNTTTDGTVVWTQLETAAELTWAANSSAFSSTKPFIVANAAGTNCLFKAQPSKFPVFKLVSGSYVTVNFYGHNSVFAGGCELRNPIDGGGIYPGQGLYPLLATATGTSVLFNPPQFNGTTDPKAQPINWATLNGAGQITGYTQPWSGANQNYTAIVTFTLTVPAAGQYTFTINHDDGMFWGMGNGATRVSGPNNAPFPTATVSALNGYPVMGGQNVSGNNNDTYVVNCPTAGDYPVEIDYCQWQNEQQLCFYCNGQTPVPGAATTGATQPIWPAWTTSFAPLYPSVNEKNNAAPGGGSGNGPIVWNNIGPKADYAWRARNQFLTTAGSAIIDPNNNTEAPYEAGFTGSTTPTFATGINQLTKDNPNLIWINQGPASAPPSGTLSTSSTQGWIYYVALVNTLTNTVSNAGPASAPTGQFIGATGVKVSGGLPSVVDPQADGVAVFRTKDGGATPLLIPGTGNLANTVATVSLASYQANGYTDTTLDSGLNILLQAPINGQNTPPGVGATNLALHLNRIFFSIGNVVYWTTGSAIPIGNGFEGVAPLNNATFPSLVKRIVPTSIGALVWTVSDIYLLAGNGTSQSPIFPVPYLPEKGINSYNALAINGSIMGAYTTAGAFMVIDPNGGFYDLGFPIGDQFKKSNWNASTAYVAWHEYGEDVAWYVCDGSTGWFRCNPTPAPESGQTWAPFATIVGGVTAIRSIEVSPGVRKLLIGQTGTSPILARDLTTNADNGTAYGAFFTIGSLVLAQPGQMAEVAFITTDSKALGKPCTLGILLDEISGTFEPLQDWVDDPPKLEPSLTTYGQRFWLLNGDNPALCRHMQIRLDWAIENQPNELLSMTLFGGYVSEK